MMMMSLSSVVYPLVSLPGSIQYKPIITQKPLIKHSRSYNKRKHGNGTYQERELTGELGKKNGQWVKYQNMLNTYEIDKEQNNNKKKKRQKERKQILNSKVTYTCTSPQCLQFTQMCFLKMCECIAGLVQEKGNSNMSMFLHICKAPLTGRAA